MSKLVLTGEQAREKMLIGVKAISSIVGSTLGPKGSNVAIDRTFGSPLVVHDGVTVARQLQLDDEAANMAIDILVDGASRTNDEAGDGTTTATVLAGAIYEQSNKVIKAGANSMMLRKGIEEGKNLMIAELTKMARPVKKEDIVEVATISAQDSIIGQCVADAFNRHGERSIVTVDENSVPIVDVEYRDGMQFDRGVISPFMCNIPERMEVDLKNVNILVSDKRVAWQELGELMDGLIKAHNTRQLVIICSGLDEMTLANIIANKKQGIFNAIVVNAPGYGDAQKALLEDIAIYTGGRFISADSRELLSEIEFTDLGLVDRVVSGEKNTLIISNNAKKELLEARIKLIKDTLAKPDTSAVAREKLEERLAKLTSGIAIVKVGANSEVEMRERKERAIDAISAVRSSIEQGIVAGGETALLKASRVLDELIASTSDDIKIGVQVLQRACHKPFELLMSNSGLDAGAMKADVLKDTKNRGIDVMSGELCDLIAKGIVDPVKVTKSALSNAVSVASQLITTDTLIVELPEKK